MDKERIRKICRERLDKWLEELVKYHSTPVLLVGVGHDDRNGEIHICVPKDLKTEYIRAFFEEAVDRLRDGNIEHV